MDWFDAIAHGNDRPALVIADEDGTRTERSFAELSCASDRIARGRGRQVICHAADASKFAEVPGNYTRISVGPVGGRPTCVPPSK